MDLRSGGQEGRGSRTSGKGGWTDCRGVLRVVGTAAIILLAGCGGPLYDVVETWENFKQDVEDLGYVSDASGPAAVMADDRSDRQTVGRDNYQPATGGDGGRQPYGPFSTLSP